MVADVLGHRHSHARGRCLRAELSSETRSYPGWFFGRPVIVENRAGSGGMIATETVSKSPADGYTLLMVAAADVVQPAMRAKLSYDLERDFAPISNVVVVPFALA